MDQATKQKLRAIRKRYVQFRMRYDRGRSLIGIIVDFMQVSVMAGLGIDLWNKYKPFGIQIPIDWLGMIMFCAIFVFYFIGWLDQTKLNIHQAENEYESTTLNPYLTKIGRDIKKIKKKING